jgi:peptidoglycan/xylan/chitin deacetylase (PgdA/CDA1 family)
VALTIDVDGEAAIINMGAGGSPKMLSMGRYGPLRGVPRLLDVLDRQGVCATFFFPGYTLEHWPDVAREVVARGHEVALHGYLHESFGSLTADEQRRIHERSIQIAEEVLGYRPVGVRPPGDYNDDTLSIVREMGYIYDSNMRGDDRPYRVSIDGEPSELIEIPLHWELDDTPYFFFGHGTGYAGVRIESPEAAYEAYTTEFDGYLREGLCYVHTCHPEMMGKPGRAIVYERLIEYMRRAGDVWFAKCEDIARWWAAATREEGAAAGGDAK